jgi:hypothetical protein
MYTRPEFGSRHLKPLWCYILERHIFLSETGVYDYCRGEDWANMHTQKFARMDNQVLDGLNIQEVFHN